MNLDMNTAKWNIWNNTQLGTTVDYAENVVIPTQHDGN